MLFIDEWFTTLNFFHGILHHILHYITLVSELNSSYHAELPPLTHTIMQNYPHSHIPSSRPRKGKRYTLLLDGGLIKGWGSKDSWLLIVCHD